ncbi:DNA topoisomerase VI subunit B [Candidatus Woesearchaeota archaeon]|nr:DNA topoisomerase VI subunit B [Candidatus Woesearchaeota archaeon]
MSLTAEDLAKSQREISISEFFVKNKHLLGFDNPRKALLTTIKEAVDNSLTYDMPILIRKKGKILLTKIGELIDTELEKAQNKVYTLRKGNLEKLPVQETIEVLAFDKKTLKLSLHPVSTLFRHKVNSKIYRIKLTSGRYIDLTAYHSIFTINQGEIISIPTSAIKVGTPIIVPRKSWNSNYDTNEINLIEELLMLDPNLTKKIFLHGINNIFTDDINNQLKELFSESRYRINDFRRFNYIPFNVLRKLKIDINKLSDSKLGYLYSPHKIPVIIKVNNKFAELLGFYVSEGSMLKSLNRIHFSFGIHEKEIVDYLSDSFEKIFKVSPKIKKAHSTAYNIIANSSIICFIFKHIFKVGDYANSKRIPDIVHNFSYNLRYSFLLAYLAGDGYPSKKLFEILKNDLTLDEIDAKKITCATASFQLFTDLQYLLSSMGFSYSTGMTKEKPRVINNIKTLYGKSYQIYIYTNRESSHLNLLPIKDTIINTSDSKISYSINRSNQNNISFKVLQNGLCAQSINIYKGVETLLESDLGILRVKSIEEIQYNHEWVYDVSVPNCENFVAGVGAILCHNSLDACEESKILPDIKVEVNPVTEDRFIIVVEDNGPGIVKEQIPKIFGKLLYGSKFHRLRVSRGQQGIGISASAMYGQLTTGKPIKIISKTGKNKPAHYFELHLDTKKNEPEIAAERIIDWEKEHGTRIEIELQAKYQKGRQSIDEYLEQTAIVNPHLFLIYKNPENEIKEFPRATNQLPKESKEIKPHPHGIELGILIKMLRETSAKTLQSFLETDFCRVSSKVAHEICQTAGLYEKSHPDRIAREEADALYKAINATKIMSPPTDSVIPLGEELILKGLKKEIQADFYTAVTRPTSVYRGNPFIIEVGLAYGGNIPKDEPVDLMRFANRVPLLYQQSACATTNSVVKTKWVNYGLSQSRGALPVGPLVLLIEITSVWVPFTSESKEAIAQYPEIIKEIKLALQDAGRELGSFIRKNVRAKEQREKIDLFEKYIPELANALSNLSNEKKSEIEENLEKILKKGLKDLLLENNIEAKPAKEQKEKIMDEIE